ncbi:MAG: hypothetical protein WC564_05505 [Patescibacteria group bacterium]|jgi:hypothetical protein
MNIEKCVSFFAVTSEKDEKITTEEVKKLLAIQKITWGQAKIIPQKEGENEETICAWSRPAEKSTFNFDFSKSFHPCAMAMTVRIINNWGYDVVAFYNKEKTIFKRPSIFYREDINGMMKAEV